MFAQQFDNYYNLFILYSLFTLVTLSAGPKPGVQTFYPTPQIVLLHMRTSISHRFRYAETTQIFLLPARGFLHLRSIFDYFY